MIKIKLQHIIEAFPQLEEDLTRLKKFDEKVPKGLSFFTGEERLEKIKDYLKIFANFFKKVGWKTDYHINRHKESIDSNVRLYRDKTYSGFYIAFNYYDGNDYIPSRSPTISVFDTRMMRLIVKIFILKTIRV